MQKTRAIDEATVEARPSHAHTQTHLPSHPAQQSALSPSRLAPRRGISRKRMSAGPATSPAQSNSSIRPMVFAKACRKLPQRLKNRRPSARCVERRIKKSAYRRTGDGAKNERAVGGGGGVRCGDVGGERSKRRPPITDANRSTTAFRGGGGSGPRSTTADGRTNLARATSSSLYRFHFSATNKCLPPV